MIPGRAIAGAVVVAAVGASATPALAAWKANGTGTGAVTAGSLSPATGFSATCGSPGNVSSSASLKWTASPTNAVTGYTITRTDTSGDGNGHNGTFTIQVSGRTQVSATDNNTLNYKNTTVSYSIKAVVTGWNWKSTAATDSVVTNGANKCN